MDGNSEPKSRGFQKGHAKAGGRKKATPLTVTELQASADYVVRNGYYPGKKNEKRQPVSDSVRARLHAMLLAERSKPGAQAADTASQDANDTTEWMQTVVMADPRLAAMVQEISISLTEFQRRKQGVTDLPFRAESLD